MCAIYLRSRSDECWVGKIFRLDISDLDKVLKKIIITQLRCVALPQF